MASPTTKKTRQAKGTISIVSPKKTSLQSKPSAHKKTPLHAIVESTDTKHSATQEQATLSAEERIIRAAHREFVSKGFDGARMQEIADVAGINKAMLHYYYRSKEQLFSAVFVSLREKMMMGILGEIHQTTTLRDALRVIVSAQINVNLEHSGLYLFVLSELARNPELVQRMFQRDDKSANHFMTVFQVFVDLIERAVKKKEIRRIEPFQLILNILSLNNFPFFAQPVFQQITGMSAENFRILQEHRKEHVVDFVMNALRP